MASTAGVTPPEGREEKAKGVGRKLLSRMKTVLRRADPSKRISTLSTSASAPPVLSESAPGPSTAPTTAPATSQPLQPTIFPTENALPQVDDTPADFEGEKISRSELYAERARHLSERFGLEMTPDAWYQTEGHVLRVHRPIRMRIHRQCHQCGGEVNLTGVCVKCNHSYCGDCKRYPPKRTEEEKVASREKTADVLREHHVNAMIVPDWNLDPSEKIVLRKPARQGGQEFVYKKARQRVRRTCCQCLGANGSEVLFLGGKLNCPNCDHARCTDCPRDPPKRTKYPYGYPGDEFGAKSTAHHKCHECNTRFPPGADDGTECAKCSHKKCDLCQRLRPQKVEPEPDPEVMRSVQEKLAALQMS